MKIYLQSFIYVKRNIVNVFSLPRNIFYKKEIQKMELANLLWENFIIICLKNISEEDF